jgi:antitoxin CptB
VRCRAPRGGSRLERASKPINRARILVADTNARPDVLDETKARLGRIAFRAWRRGFREADLVLGPFAEQMGPSLDERDLTDFETLLMLDDDHRLYAWIIGTEAAPAEYETPVMARVRAFMAEHVAAEVAKGAG